MIIFNTAVRTAKWTADRMSVGTAVKSTHAATNWAANETTFKSAHESNWPTYTTALESTDTKTIRSTNKATGWKTDWSNI